MRVFLSPQGNKEKIYYHFENEKVTITINNVTEVFDFSGLPDGKLNILDDETGEELFETKLPINPFISVEKKDGVLYLELLNWISEDATYNERFPEWIGANEVDTNEDE